MKETVEKVKCQLCGQEVSIRETYVWSGLRICEDCYFDRAFHVRTCDPLAVYSAKQTLKMAGVKAEEKLTETQKAIHDLIKSKGKVTMEELSRELNIPRRELEIQIAILRHLELIKGQKEGTKTYIVPWNIGQQEQNSS